MESFWVALKVELIDDKAYASHTVAKQDIFQYNEGSSIQRCRHSALGYLSSAEYEHRYGWGLNLLLL